MSVIDVLQVVSEPYHADYHPVESAAEDIVQSSVDPASATRDELGRLVFDDAPGFTPTLTPKEVIQAGSFGGYGTTPLCHHHHDHHRLTISS